MSENQQSQYPPNVPGQINITNQGAGTRYIVPGVGVFVVPEGGMTDAAAEQIMEMVEQAPDPETHYNTSGKSKPPGIPTPTTYSDVGPFKSLGRQKVGEGPLGIVSPKTRTEMRAATEDAGIYGEIAKIGIPTAGQIAGFALSPPGMGIPNSMLGGTLAETAAQELGVSPRSPENVALSTTAPLVGEGMGQVMRGARFGLGKLFNLMPPIRAARGRLAVREAREKLESIGGQILTKTAEAFHKVPGVGNVTLKSATQMWERALNTGARVDGHLFSNTHKAINELRDSYKMVKGLKHVKQAVKVLDDAQKALSQKDLDFKTINEVRMAIGDAVKAASQGAKRGSAKQVYKQMNKDLDELAKRPQSARSAKALKAAVWRSKLDFSIRDLERIVAKHTHFEDGLEIVRVKNVLKNIMDITNPKHKMYDRNFASALKDHLPDIKGNLKYLTDLKTTGSPAGPGSIVVRGRLARGGSQLGAIGATAMGGWFLGDKLAGVTGAAGGALIGTTLPEILTASLMSRRGSAFLRASAKLGKGDIGHKKWMAMSQLLMRSAGAQEEDIHDFMRGPIVNPEIEEPVEEPGEETEEGTPAEESSQAPEEEVSPLELAIPEIERMLTDE